MAVSWLLRGPVCKSFLPDIKAEVPENGGEDLLLGEEFLRNCVGIFSLSPTALATNSRPFAQKHLNIIDPLRENNNLGRSVNRGNFYQIHSALKHGARKLGCILLLPVERIADELNMFFSSTPGRHGNIWNDKELATTGNLDVRKTNALSDCLPLKSNLGTLVLEYAEHATHFNMSGLFRKNGKIENWKPCLKMPAKAVTTNEIHSALLPVGRKHLAGSNLVSCCINQNGVASTCSVVSGSAAKISPPNGEKYTSGVLESLEGLECLLELSGDYDSHVRNLQYSQLCHGHALSSPLFPSLPMSPRFQSNPCEDVCESQQIKRNIHAQIHERIWRFSSRENKLGFE